jgi:hypothetical protein
MQRVYGFAGAAGSGKDTAAKYLIEHHGFVRVAFADRLKSMLLVGLGLNPADYDTPEKKSAMIPWLGCTYRKAAQTLGTEWGRLHINLDLWPMLALRDVEVALQNHPGVVITDVRFPNEQQALRRIGAQLIHIVRPELSSSLSGTEQAHISEKALEVLPGDEIVFNDSLVGRLHEEMHRLHWRLSK